jgi:hypothetical protein
MLNYDFWYSSRKKLKNSSTKILFVTFKIIRPDKSFGDGNSFSFGFKNSVINLSQTRI